MDSLIETFHIDLKTIIAQAVNFAVVLVVLYFFALKPLKKIMDERSKTIEGGINDAKVNAEVLKNTKIEYDKMLAQARTEATAIFNQGKKEGEAEKMQMIENGKKEVANIIENGKKTLEAEKVKMVEEAKKEVAGLVLKATEKILEEKGK